MAKWSAKDERQYEHIKESARKRGQSRRAKEIAARTVNKQRREEGRTGDSPSARSSRAGTRSTRGSRRTASGNGSDLKSQTRQELYQRARRLNIPGRSQMNKSQLVRALQKQA